MKNVRSLGGGGIFLTHTVYVNRLLATDVCKLSIRWCWSAGIVWSADLHLVDL